MRRELLAIAEKMHSTPVEVLQRKFRVAPFGEDEDLSLLGPYHRYGLTFGKTPGPLHPVVTTGPCILPSIDIQELKAHPGRADDIFERQPTLQNLICNGSQSPGEVHLILETREFAGLATDLTGRPEDDMLDASIGVARRTWEGMQRSCLDCEATPHYTHEPKVDEAISRLATEHQEDFFKRIPRYHSDPDPHIARLRKLLAERGPADIFALRIFATYYPGWWGEDADAHTIIENMHHYYIHDWGPDRVFVPILPPRSLDGKKEMDEGRGVYVGTREHGEQAIAELESRIPMKSPYACPVGNLVPYAVRGEHELAPLLSCASDREVDADRCAQCIAPVNRLIRAAATV